MPSIIEYTARRSLYSGHTVGEKYDIEVDIAINSAQQQVEEVKFIERADSGLMEQGLERIDVSIPLTLTLVGGSTLMQLREFLDSTESGETFRVWTCDDGDSPRDTPFVLKRLDDGHTEMPFIRGGSRLDDFFTIDIIGIVSGELTPDGAVADSDGGDIYDPINDEEGGGTGGLNPPGSGALEVSLDAHDVYNTGTAGSGAQQPGFYLSVASADVTFGQLMMRAWNNASADHHLEVDGVDYPGSTYDEWVSTGEWWAGGGAAPTTDYEIKVDHVELTSTAISASTTGTFGSYVDLTTTTPRWELSGFMFNSSGNWTGTWTVTIRRKSDSQVLGSVVYTIEMDHE